MFKIVDIGVRLERIPTWVWGSLVLGGFFFGVLYMVPEARQVVGRLFTDEPIDAKKQPPTTKPAGGPLPVKGSFITLGELTADEKDRGQLICNREHPGYRFTGLRIDINGVKRPQCAP
jgi:hypothetical protein